jgi:outer membrane assembly lipoprotein YfiO
VINTRKRTILSAFLILMTTTALTGGSLIISEPEKTTSPAQTIDLALPSLETKPYKSRMRKTRSKKSKKEKKIRTYLDMSYDELIPAKDLHIAKNNMPSAIKYLEQMMKLCSDITKLAEHLLEIADLFFQDGQFQKASRLYTEYSTLYPGSDKMEYALHRAIQSSFACILPSDRDQTKTEETVGLTEIFLLQDHFITHREEVKQVQLQCYEQLASSECNVCYFYITRDRFTAAEKRLKKIRTTWLPRVPALEMEIVALETQLAEKKDAAELLRLKNTELTANKELLASNKKTKRMTDRF